MNKNYNHLLIITIKIKVYYHFILVISFICSMKDYIQVKMEMEELED